MRWYDAATVRELSGEEAKIITDRVLASSDSARELAAADRDRLRDAMADALYSVFAGHDLAAGSRPGTLRDACIRAVETAAVAIIGPDGAREITSILGRDLG